MTFAEIDAARGIAGANRKGTAFRHSLTQSHVFVTQYPLAWDRPELYSAEFERAYELMKTGRAMSGHLRYVGDEQVPVRFNGLVHLPRGCDGVAVATAERDLELMLEFFRGDVETNPYSDAYPYPLLHVGHGTGGYRIFTPPFSPGSSPFAPGSAPFGSDGLLPLWGDREPYWMKSTFIYQAGSFTKGESTYEGVDIIRFSFTLVKMPSDANVIYS